MKKRKQTVKENNKFPIKTAFLYTMIIFIIRIIGTVKVVRNTNSEIGNILFNLGGDLVNIFTLLILIGSFIQASIQVDIQNQELEITKNQLEEEKRKNITDKSPVIVVTPYESNNSYQITLSNLGLVGVYNLRTTLVYENNKKLNYQKMYFIKQNSNFIAVILMPQMTDTTMSFQLPKGAKAKKIIYSYNDSNNRDVSNQITEEYLIGK